MSRLILRQALALAVLFYWAANIPAADKATSTKPEDARARSAVQAALAAEARGDNVQRAELLRSAEEYSPEFPEAKWHSGKVLIESKWVPLADAELVASTNSQREEYRQRRTKAGTNVKLLRDLARWSTKTGQDDVARLHYAQLLSRSDTAEDLRQEAIKRLDLHYAGSKKEFRGGSA
jgi:hypothetical protein